MGYKIQYLSVGKKQYKPFRKKRRWLPPVVIVGICLMLCILAITNDNLYYHFLPGDPVVTEAAIREMIDHLAAGEPFYEAVTAFCREVITGAQ